MLHILRRIGLLRRKPLVRSRAPRLRLTVECLESRDVPAPLAPTGLVATAASASSIALTWNASTDPTVTGYDVYLRTFFAYPHGGGHYVYTSVASNLTTPSDTVTGLASNSKDTYVVTAVSAAGQSPYSYAATARTWVAPFLDGNYYDSITGYESSGPVAATVGLTTQMTLLGSGNPLTFSMVSGPATMSVDQNTGVVTYTPTAGDVGTVNATFEVSNALGSSTATFQFTVSANSSLPTPTLTISGLTATYNGQGHYFTGTAVGSDGVTPVAGTFGFATNGNYNQRAVAPGTYSVLATFTSSDPNYGNATALTTLTISKATPTFSNLTSPAIVVGTATTTVSGTVAAGTAFPVGDYVVVTLNGVSQEVTVGTNGRFSTTFNTSSLAVGNYTVSYSFVGDSNYTDASSSSTQTVLAPVAPTVTTNPLNNTVAAESSVSFTAAATGTPAPTVQWQVSTDGGNTWSNVTGNATATTTTLTFTVTESDNGYQYRAVFTNSSGSATTSAATLTVQE
jgi:hypothetical protein